MSRIKNDPVFNKHLIEMLDEIIDKGHWGNALFLQTTGKKLRELREDLKNGLEFPGEPSTPDKATLIHRYTASKKATDDNDLQLVFILLYCSEGSNLKRWETIITSLPVHSMTRPVYKNETDIQTMIRSKANRENDGYLAINVNKSDINPTFTNIKTVPGVRNKNELVVLREGSIHQENIEYFVHFTGRYMLQNDRLVRVE